MPTITSNIVKKLPTMASGNQTFMQNNPQYGPAGAALQNKANGGLIGDFTNGLKTIGNAIGNAWNSGPGRPTTLGNPVNTGGLSGGTIKSPPSPVAPKTGLMNNIIPTANAQITQTSSQSAPQSTPSVSAPAQTQTAQTTAPPTPASTFQTAAKGLTNIGQGGGSANTGLYQNWLQQQAQNPNVAQGAINTLSGLSTSQSPEVLKQEEAYNTFAQQNPYMLAAQSNPNVAADVASGRTSLLGQTFAAEQQAKAQAVQNALTGQGQQIQAGTNAGQLGLQGQQQQIGAAENAGTLGLTNQGQQIGALGNAGTLTAPHFNGYVGLSPETGQAIGGGQAGSAAFQGGQTNTAEANGALYTQNKAAIDSLNGSNGNTGMKDNFMSILKGNNLNQSDTAVLNGLFNAFNGLGPAQSPVAQNAFNNIMAQYANILGPQKISSMMENAKGTRISDFFDSLDAEAKAVQGGLQSSSGNNQGTASIESLRSKYNY